MKLIYSLILVLLLTGAASLVAQPITLHPENPHYFLFRGKPTVLVTSGEHYGAVMNLDFNYDTYLETIAADGLNLTRLFSGVYVEGWGEPWNTLNPPHGRYIAPWARSETPGYSDGGNKFDLTRWDPAYFERLKDFVRKAGERGIVVEMVLFCVYYNDDNWRLSPLNAASNVNGIGNTDRFAPYDETDPDLMRVQEAFTRKIVSELKEFDNVYFELLNEPYADQGPQVDDSWNDRIIAAIRAETKDHLIALNVANDSARVDAINPEVGILNFHYAFPPNAVTMNYDHPRVISDDETGFDGGHDESYRKEAWAFMLAGGGAYSNLDWSFTVDSPEGTSEAVPDDLGGGSPTLRMQLGHLKRFLDGFDFIRMRPDNGIFKGGLSEDVQAWALAEEGRAYAIYVHGGDQVNLRVTLPEGNYRVEWLDTKSGEYTPAETLTHPGGDATLTSPPYDTDVALSIKRVE